MKLTRPVLVVFCHLRWSGVWQRPQQILSRLSRDFDVIFHEEPVADLAEDATPAYERFLAAPQIEVLQPHTAPQPVYGYHQENWDQLRSMLQAVLQEARYRNRPLVAWCYTPMAYPVAAAIQPDALVYDCMDELALFRFAPDGIADLEQRLVANADAIFCGGSSMYRNRKDRHPNVHLLLSGVDRVHFAHAHDPATEEPEVLAAIPHPRIGYWGVLDERIDWDLLAACAEQRPDWHWVLVGPFAKVDPDTLPHAANLHYLGPADYADLPRFGSGFDVAMMPFALNDATRYISPTKTLEYMAAGLPIVSTPVADVVDPYEGPVWIAGTPDQFLLAIQCLYLESPQSRARRLDAYQTWIDRWSWDAIAGTMRYELMRALAKSHPVVTPADPIGNLHLTQTREEQTRAENIGV